MGFFGCLGQLEAVFAFLGTVILLIFLATTLYYVTKNIYVFYFAEFLGRTVDFKALGEWAVVTGGTDGIGKGYAFDLARRGCNIILIARTESKLKSVAQEIENTYKVRTKIIIADFSADDSIYDTIKDGLRDLEIGVLINNVGVGVPAPDHFHLMAGGEATYSQMIRVNCTSQTLMTRIIIPQMITRGKGVIVHLCSASGVTPLPFAACYSASKAYNGFLGRALQIEYEDSGIINQVLMPYLVATNMTKISAGEALFATDYKVYTRSCLNTVGFFNNTNGHPTHAIQHWVVGLIPQIFMPTMLRSVVAEWRRGQKISIGSKSSSDPAIWICIGDPARWLRCHLLAMSVSTYLVAVHPLTSSESFDVCPIQGHSYVRTSEAGCFF